MTIQAEQAAAPEPTSKPEVGSRENPQRVEIPGAKARHESRAKAGAGVSRNAMVKAVNAMRTRGPDGKFVRAAPTPEADQPEASQPTVDGVDPAALEGEQTTETEAPAKPDARVVEAESKLARAIEREARYREGSRQAGEKIADLTDEVEHYKSLFAAARATIRQHLGTDIDEREIEHRTLQMQLNRYKRGSQQQEEAQRAQQVGQLAASIKAQAASVMQKHPELNPETNPQAKAWWAAWFKGDNKIEDLASDAEGASLLFRARQVQQAQKAAEAKRPPVPQAVTRPEATIPRAAAGASPPTKQRPADKVSAKAMVTHMQQFRAARGR